MRIPSELLKCVCFLGFEMATGDRRIVGTGFLLARNVLENTPAVCLITARHVVEGIRGKGLDHVAISANMKDGGTLWHKIPLAEWYMEASENSPDVAVALTIPFSDKWDHLFLPEDGILTAQKRAVYSVGPGDDVFIMGFFSKHKDAERNEPIVRMGTIAALDVKRIDTRYGQRPGHLIETRSIGGLSGSPVFYRAQATRMVAGNIQTLLGTPFGLFGLIHGHFDEKFEDNGEVDISSRDRYISINLGIAVVVPLHDITKIIDNCINDRVVGHRLKPWPAH